MKRMICLALTLLWLPVCALAQAQINTKKVKIADLPEKTIKVVLTGNPVEEGCLRSDMMSWWRLSPYEFCDRDEFNRLKTSDEYYFLLRVRSEGLDWMTLVKGGEKATEGIEKMLNVISVPLCVTGDDSGRDLTLTGPVLNIIQTYVQDAIRTDLRGYSGLPSYNFSLPASAGKRIILAEGDLADNVTREDRAAWEEQDIHVLATDEVSDLLSARVPDTVIGYCIRPVEKGWNGLNILMLIDASTHHLYFYKRSRMIFWRKSGFTPCDIRSIQARRKVN